MSKVNIIVNGKHVGEQSIAGEMQSNTATTQSAPTTSRVLVNGVPVNETKKDEFPPLPAAIQNMVDKKTGAVDMRLEQETSTNWNMDDSFSLAENYSQWANLKKNHSLDKMFLASTPDAMMHLINLHKYIEEVLNLDKGQVQINRKDDDSDEEGEESGSVFASPNAKPKLDGGTKRKPGPKPKK